MAQVSSVHPSVHADRAVTLNDCSCIIENVNRALCMRHLPLNRCRIRSEQEPTVSMRATGIKTGRGRAHVGRDVDRDLAADDLKLAFGVGRRTRLCTLVPIPDEKDGGGNCPAGYKYGQHYRRQRHEESNRQQDWIFCSHPPLSSKRMPRFWPSYKDPKRGVLKAVLRTLGWV